MNAFQRLLNQVRDFFGGMSPIRRFLILSAALFLILALGSLVYFSSTTNYKVTFSNLTSDEAGAIADQLKTQNIPFQYGRDESTILVPENLQTQARVAIARSNIPLRGGKGFELFDENSLGMTPFVQNVNYIRALQAELARSIQQLEPVAAARVIIARAEPTPFVRDQKPTTASVVLKLKPNYGLNRSTAASIVALVARSVEGLRPENVTVVDSIGRLLSDPRAGTEEQVPSSQIEYRRELETYLAGKAEEMLARHLGVGRAIVRVSADLDFAKLKERSETYNPENRVVANEKTTNSKTTSSSGARGVAGAVSNTSRGGGTGSGGAGSSQDETTETNFLVSKTVRDLEDHRGSIKRLTIAALVDLSPDENATGTKINLTDVQEILKQALGYQNGRDEIKVSDVKLASGLPVPEEDTESQRYQQLEAYVSLARNISLSVAVVVTLILLGLLLLRRRQPVPEPTQPATGELNAFTQLALQNPDRVVELLTQLLGGATR